MNLAFRIIFTAFVVLSLVATAMVVNFWRDWLSMPVVPHAEYPPTPLPQREHQHYVNGKLRTFHVWSDGPYSVATVEVQGRNGEGAEPWVTLATIVNPDARGELWSLPEQPRYLRVSVSAYVSGGLGWSGSGCEAPGGVMTTLTQTCSGE